MTNFKSMHVPLLAILFLLQSVSSSEAGKPFRDDFEDGSISDNQPVTWSIYAPPFDAGKAELLGGSLVLTPSTEKDPYPGDPEISELDMVVSDQMYHNISVETVVRATGPNVWAAGIGGLDTFFTNGKQGKGVYGFIDNEGGLSINYASDSDASALGRFTTQLSFLKQDIHLKFDVINDRVNFSAWAEGDQPPAAPQISRLLPIPVRPPSHQGRPVVVSLSRSDTPDGFAFRYVSVVPEPAIGGISVLAILGLLRHRRKAPPSGHRPGYCRASV